eukprot:2490704-Pleurochrysis_carterae.AAC.1
MLQSNTRTQPAATAPTAAPAITRTVAVDPCQSDPTPNPPSQADRTDVTDHPPMDEVNRRVPFQRGL